MAEPKPKAKVGDAIRITYVTPSANLLFKVGDVGLVKSVEPAADRIWYSAVFPCAGDWDWVFDEEFEVVT